MKGLIVLGISLLLFLVNIDSAQCQKKYLDNSCYKIWPTLKEIGTDINSIVSNSGGYFAYIYGSEQYGDSLMISDVNESVICRKKAPEKHNESASVQFTSDDKEVVFMFDRDSLMILDIGTGKARIAVNRVEKFDVVELGGDKRYLLLKNVDAGIRIINMQSSRVLDFGDYDEYFFSGDKEAVVYLKSYTAITQMKLLSQQLKYIAQDRIIQKVSFNPKNKNICFLSEQSGVSSIYMYDYVADNLREVFSSKSGQVPPGFRLSSGLLSVTPDERKIIVSLEEKAVEEKKIIEPENQRLWSYKDKYINERVGQHRVWTCVVSVVDASLVKLFDQVVMPIESLMPVRKNHYLAGLTQTNSDEYYWNSDSMNLLLFSLETGEMRNIHRFTKSFVPIVAEMSPDENFIVWTDNETKNYYSYEIATGLCKNITEKAKVEFFDERNDITIRRLPFGIAGWLPRENAVLINDEYDIWEVDLHGNRTPKCLTKKIGERNNIKFRIVTKEQVFSKKEELLLSVFDVDNKNNGFAMLNMKEDFVYDDNRLGPFCYSDNNSTNARGMHIIKSIPQKAKDKTLYVVRRETAYESPNLFITKNFVNYRQITRIHPERDYKWYKTKLVQWQLEGKPRQSGILYYPDQLDTTKKYPIIMHYYEKKSDELNVYKRPELSEGDLKIPWYVSNGFLVFVPDIYNEGANLRATITRSIIAALDTLGTIKWIDTTKVGLQGHSHGGYETLLLVTSKKFTAAQESSGVSDLVSSFSHVFANITRQTFNQYDQKNLLFTPWENRNVFIQNSPIFHVQLINTPLFIMHNPRDANVPYYQANEIYAALRRLRKPAWFIEYLNEGHVLEDNTNKLDFTIKQQQFFTYYLKNGQQPYWMTP